MGRDLFLVNRQDARIWGWADEFISTPKLDDLACAYTSLQAFLGAENAHDVSVFCCFDNEEVGSETKQERHVDVLGRRAAPHQRVAGLR